MKRLLATLGAAAFLAAPAFTTLAFAAPTSHDDALDIGALLDTADAAFDLDQQDAVVLERTDTVRWLADGRRELAVHEIVWIRTEHGIDLYADLRVPFDAARCDFEVDALRTWRDEQWWTATETAIVETLPRGLTSADDYVDAREMMLLHDGVEIPCIMETAYRIVDKEPFRTNVDGVHLLARRDPAVRSRFVLAVPSDAELGVSPAHSESGPAFGDDAELGLETFTWTLADLPERGRPFTSDPGAAEPHVAWSTWPNWSDLADHVTATFDDALVLDDALRDSVAAIVEDAPMPLARAHRIAEFVERATRAIAHQPEGWLGAPRPADRVYATAYGNRLDRAVLAAALFREAGLAATPVWRSSPGASVATPVASLARFTGPHVAVSGAGAGLVFDASRATLGDAASFFRGRQVWDPTRDALPRLRERAAGPGRADVQLRVARDAETGEWTGSGLYSGTGALNPYGEMAGLGNETAARLKSIVSGVIADAKVPSHNPAAFDPQRVLLAFDLTAPVADDDAFDRIPLILGEPAGGLFAALPSDVHLHEATRATPVSLSGILEQTIRVVLDVKGLDVVRAPEARELENDAGTFRLTVERRQEEDAMEGEERDELVVTRWLSLSQATYAASDWPALRALLLADRHERGRTILLRPEK